MLNFLATLGADSQFQKNRLILTKPNYDGPNEQAMRNILHTFAGEDQQTRSQIAFACIIKKIYSSSSKDNWLYLLKNLIILDRIMSENRFCQQLAQTTLDTVQNYVDKDIKGISINSNLILKNFWKLIRDMSGLKISKNHILYYKRSERKTFIQTLHTHQIFKQIQILQKMFDNCISLIFLASGVSNKKQQIYRHSQFVTQKTKKYHTQFTASTLAEYLSIHFYSKLLTFFSCQYLCIHKFIQIILHTAKTDQCVQLEDAKQFKKMVYKFKQNCKNMALFAEKNKSKKGFQHIDTKQFSTFSEQHIIKAIDQYINQNTGISQFQRQNKIEQLITFEDSHLKVINSQKFVDKKPLIYDQYYSVSQKSPRKFISCKRQYEEYSVFGNYFSSYSDQFPHKNMMTLDLIEDIKRDQQRQFQDILNQIKQDSNNSNIVQVKQNKEKSQIDFFKEFKKTKSKSKIRDLLIFSKQAEKQQKQQQKQDSTSYSYKNSSRRASMLQVLNIKWVPQRSQA